MLCHTVPQLIAQGLSPAAANELHDAILLSEMSAALAMASTQNAANLAHRRDALVREYGVSEHIHDLNATLFPS